MHVIDFLLPPAPLVLFHELPDNLAVLHEDNIVETQLLTKSVLEKAARFKAYQCGTL